MSNDTANQPQPKEKKKLSTLAKIGIGCAGVIVLGILLIIVLAVIGAIASDAIPAALEKRNETTSGKQAPTAMEVSAVALHRAYNDNEVAADEQFKGKLLRVTGTVSGIKKDFMDDIYVELDTGEMFGELHASFRDNQKSKIMALRKGQSITFEGSINGFLMNSVMMRNCQIVGE